MDVIEIVSSDEEGNNETPRKRVLISNKNLTIKKIKTPLKSKTIPTQKVNTICQNNNKTMNSKRPALLMESVVIKSPAKRYSLNEITIVPVNSNNNTTINSTADSIEISEKNVRTNIDLPVTTNLNEQPTRPIIKVTTNKIKRITPTQISNEVTVIENVNVDKSSPKTNLNIEEKTNSSAKFQNSSTNELAAQPNENELTPMYEEFNQLIKACRESDPTDDMHKIINKLEKYYHRAHPDFVLSKSFRKNVKTVTNEIRQQPKLVYMKINTLLEELKTRRNIENPSHGNDSKSENDDIDEKKARKIQRLSDALRKLQKRIRKCEQAEVDWEDELNSKYLITERYKKRACEIYEKLCELTGESRSAERMIKKPIKFNGSPYKEFNRKLEKFINETKTFPDMFDVLRIVHYCNDQYDYRLSKEETMSTAQEAFHKVGTTLQKRRKADLYEMVQYFTNDQMDPAGEDPFLKSKLEENQRQHNKRIKEIIDKYAKNNSESEENTEDHRSPLKDTINTDRLPTTSDHSTAQAISSLPIGMETNTIDDSIIMINDSDDLIDITRDEPLLDPIDAGELEREFLPMISSVTSLHPSQFNELMKFDTSHTESGFL